MYDLACNNTKGVKSMMPFLSLYLLIIKITKQNIFYNTLSGDLNSKHFFVRYRLTRCLEEQSFYDVSCEFFSFVETKTFQKEIQTLMLQRTVKLKRICETF